MRREGLSTVCFQLQDILEPAKLLTEVDISTVVAGDGVFLGREDEGIFWNTENVHTSRGVGYLDIYGYTGVCQNSLSPCFRVEYSCGEVRKKKGKYWMISLLCGI